MDSFSRFTFSPLLKIFGVKVWAGGSPSQKRKPSGSSATSANDLSSTYTDSPYTNFGEAWSSSSRPTSGNWDDVNVSSPHKTDVSQLVSRYVMLSAAVFH